MSIMYRTLDNKHPKLDMQINKQVHKKSINLREKQKQSHRSSDQIQFELFANVHSKCILIGFSDYLLLCQLLFFDQFFDIKSIDYVHLIKIDVLSSH